MRDLSGVQPLAQELHRFPDIVLGIDIDMDLRFASVLLEKILVDQVDVRDLHHFLLEIAVILDINAVRYGHIGDRRGFVDPVRADLHQNLSPVHTPLPLYFAILYNVPQ